MDKEEGETNITLPKEALKIILDHMGVVEIDENSFYQKVDNQTGRIFSILNPFEGYILHTFYYSAFLIFCGTVFTQSPLFNYIAIALIFIGCLPFGVSIILIFLNLRRDTLYAALNETGRTISSCMVILWGYYFIISRMAELFVKHFRYLGANFNNISESPLYISLFLGTYILCVLLSTYVLCTILRSVLSNAHKKWEFLDIKNVSKLIMLINFPILALLIKVVWTKDEKLEILSDLYIALTVLLITLIILPMQANKVTSRYLEKYGSFLRLRKDLEKKL